MTKCTIKELHILVGLPGSGKTTFAENFKNAKYSYPKKNLIFNFDEIYKKCKTKRGDFKENLEEVFEKKIPRSQSFEYIILDGLFISQEDIEMILDMVIKNETFKKKFEVKKIVIDYWVPNKEDCIWNDRGRRAMKSVETIKALDIKKPNHKAIQEKLEIPTKIDIHYVKRKPEYVVFVEEYTKNSIEKDKYIYSTDWCLGGSYRGWDDSCRTIDGEKPVEFDEFDALLEKICPNITFLKYKKLYKECVEMEEFDNSDYYSNITKARWVCNLEILFDMLKEMGYTINID